MATRINDDILNRSKLMACAKCCIIDHITMSKSFRYGGVVVPFDKLEYSYGNVFTFNNNTLYCNIHCIIRVNYNLQVEGGTDGYYALLGNNGTYSYSGGASHNGLGSSTLSGCYEFEINAGESVYLALGRNETYNNTMVYTPSSMGVSIVRLLD